MDITPSHRARLSRQYGFEPDALEKTVRALRVLDAINQHKALAGIAYCAEECPCPCSTRPCSVYR